MSEPFIGEIKIVGFNFAPRGWSFCDGQLLPIAQNTALFSLLGTTYGGDGRTTFALPDLRGRTAIHPGQGPGLSNRRWGAKGGVETVTLNTTQIPPHHHGTAKIDEDANSDQASGGVLANTSEDIYSTAGNLNSANVGGGQPHDNMQPWLALYHVIAMVGSFPSRS